MLRVAWLLVLLAVAACRAPQEPSLDAARGEKPAAPATHSSSAALRDGGRADAASSATEQPGATSRATGKLGAESSATDQLGAAFSATDQLGAAFSAIDQLGAASSAALRDGGRPDAGSSKAALPALLHIVRLTGGARETDRLPMITALHGLGNTPEGFARLFRSYRRPARVVLPQAPRPARPEGFSWFRIRLDERTGKLHLSEADILASAGRIAALVRSLAEAHPTSGKPVCVGFSQGGILAFALALHHPHSFGLVVPISGTLPPALVPEALDGRIVPPIRALHGGRDRLVRIGPTLELVADLRARGLDATLRTYPRVRHTIDARMRKDLFELLDSALEADAASTEKERTR
ncbi:MAG: dienelactone hydrolase family protein [Deltaproteobacteria bacterium]|nr:dienelactone hydrolase family protein [Deltaproteobacteria bacterium]